jgi:hypothetical protein
MIYNMKMNMMMNTVYIYLYVINHKEIEDIIPPEPENEWESDDEKEGIIEEKNEI